MTFEGSDDAVLAELGRRLACERVTRNLTQDALARQAGVSTSTLRRLESGRSTQLAAFLRILRALRLLGNLETLVPLPAVWPLELLDRRGVPRRRASSPRRAGKSGKPDRPWVWGDDK